MCIFLYFKDIESFTFFLIVHLLALPNYVNRLRHNFVCFLFTHAFIICLFNWNSSIILLSI